MDLKGGVGGERIAEEVTWRETGNGKRKPPAKIGKEIWERRVVW